jgi:IstB-like ATP binding protein
VRQESRPSGYRVLFQTLSMYRRRGPHRAPPAHRRRDRLPIHRPAGRQPVVPAHQPPLRARPHDPDQQPGLRQLGGGLRRPIIATAILDRILHHAITLNILGNSYRLKDKLKAGLVRPAEATE